MTFVSSVRILGPGRLWDTHESLGNGRGGIFSSLSQARMWAWTEKASSTYLKLSAIFDVGYRTRSKSEPCPYASHASPPETFLVTLEISGFPL